MSDFTKNIELMHTYWAEGDEVHNDLNQLLELHRKEVREVIETIENVKNPCDDCYSRFCESCKERQGYSIGIEKELARLKEKQCE